MPLREATTEDIPALHAIRMAVRENKLRNPSLVSTEDYVRYLTTDGKGWLFEENGEIKGDTRAEKFYLRKGWKNQGLRMNGEIKFTMSVTDYEKM